MPHVGLNVVSYVEELGERINRLDTTSNPREYGIGCVPPDNKRHGRDAGDEAQEDQQHTSAPPATCELNLAVAAFEKSRAQISVQELQRPLQVGSLGAGKEGGRPNEPLGKISEVCRRMPEYGQIRAISGEQSCVGPLGSEMGSVR